MPPPGLAELLEQRRAALEALPGVVGTAVGAEAIHVYVAPGTDTARLRPEAERLLDAAPVELIEATMPEAQSD